MLAGIEVGIEVRREEAPVPSCMRPGCVRAALTWWWQLCLDCTRPLLDPEVEVVTDVLPAAAEWAERLAPKAWGPRVETDDWVVTVRCLALASAVATRSTGCQHTLAGDGVTVLVVPRATGVLRCPACAEGMLAQSTVTESACDRCGDGSGPVSRVCLTGGASVIVAMLCGGCSTSVRVPVPAPR